MNNVLAELSALRDAPTPVLKRRWRELFCTEPPPYNRTYLVSRLSYRIQELAYGGLKQDTEKRLNALSDALDSGGPFRQRSSPDRKPIAGTRLIREWQGVEHCATVTQDGYEYAGRPFKSLTAVAKAITGTKWNGWIFFGLKSARGRS